MIVAVIVLGVLVLALFALSITRPVNTKTRHEQRIANQRRPDEVKPMISQAEGWLTATAERSAGQ